MAESDAQGLDELISQLTAAVDTSTQRKHRVIVATDWSRAAMPLTVLKAFRTLVPSTVPMELVFAVPHDPTEADAACIQVLVEGVDEECGLAGLEIVSFAQAVQEPYDSAIVPSGDAEQELSELGGFILRIQDLVRRHEGSRDGAVPTGPVNPGSPQALQERLNAFVG